MDITSQLFSLGDRESYPIPVRDGKARLDPTRRVRDAPGPQRLVGFLVKCPQKEGEKSSEGRKENGNFRATEVKERKTFEEADSSGNSIREVRWNGLRSAFWNCRKSLKTFRK